jgi:hypothetical protein
MIEQPQGQPGFGRNFGFLVYDVSRLIKRRFDRQARQTGLPITQRQGAVMLDIARNKGVSRTEVATWLDLEPIALVRMHGAGCARYDDRHIVRHQKHLALMEEADDSTAARPAGPDGVSQTDGKLAAAAG